MEMNCQVVHLHLKQGEKSSGSFVRDEGTWYAYLSREIMKDGEATSVKGTNKCCPYSMALIFVLCARASFFIVLYIEFTHVEIFSFARRAAQQK